MSIQDDLRGLAAELNASDRMGKDPSTEVIYRAIEEIERLEAKLSKIRPYLEEIWLAHRDRNDADYNSCEEAECAWCQETREALSDE